jgi:glycosyltransferase involved in cell wall biosynthesis
MRILIFSTHFHPYRGGLENYLIELSTRLIKKNVKIDVLTYNTQGAPYTERYKEINIYRIDCWDILKGVYALPLFNKKTRNLLKKLSLQKYDFVVTNTRFFSTSFIGWRFAKKNKIRLLHIEHGNRFVIHRNPIITFFAWLYDITFGRMIISKAWKVVGVSSPCCDFARRMGARDVALIYNSIDTDFFRKKETNLKKNLGIHNKTVVSFTGRLIFAKGVQDLITAMEGVPNSVLIVVGDGPYRKTLEKLAKSKKVDAKFLGDQNIEKIVEVLSISDIFVNPSFSEGLPSSVLEAAAVGVPVIATDVGGTREIIGSGRGLLIKPKNSSLLRSKINWLIQNPKAAENFRKNAMKNVLSKFSWDRNAEIFYRLLNEGK